MSHDVQATDASLPPFTVNSEYCTCEYYYYWLLLSFVLNATFFFFFFFFFFFAFDLLL